MKSLICFRWEKIRMEMWKIYLRIQKPSQGNVGTGREVTVRRGQTVRCARRERGQGDSHSPPGTHVPYLVLSIVRRGRVSIEITWQRPFGSPMSCLAFFDMFWGEKWFFERLEYLGYCLEWINCDILSASVTEFSGWGLFWRFWEL